MNRPHWLPGLPRKTKLVESRARARRRSLDYRPSIELLEVRTLLSGPSVVVHPGDSIQAAVDGAKPGTTIYIEPGDYAQTVVVAKARISIIGLRDALGDGVVIENPGSSANGVTVTATGSEFVLKDVVIEHFGQNGVILAGTNGFDLEGITATDNGDYGLFPVYSSHGLIDNCTARGHRDTGIYVGQSTDILVTHNAAFDNVNGIEIENSSRIVVSSNESFNNVVGVLVDLLPGLQVTVSSNIMVSGNFVHDNNHVNFAEPGDITSFEPTGTGILILGTDHTTIEGNLVLDNNSVGIGLASSLLISMLGALPPSAFAGIDPNPSHTSIVNNVVLGNGSTSPVPTIPGADLLWDGSGRDNFWSGNIYGSSFPLQLPSRH
jgi:parallel beta-helix repeat protein